MRRGVSPRARLRAEGETDERIPRRDSLKILITIPIAGEHPPHYGLATEFIHECCDFREGRILGAEIRDEIAGSGSV